MAKKLTPEQYTEVQDASAEVLALMFCSALDALDDAFKKKVLTHMARINEQRDFDREEAQLRHDVQGDA